MVCRNAQIMMHPMLELSAAVSLRAGVFVDLVHHTLGWPLPRPVFCASDREPLTVSVFAVEKPYSGKSHSNSRAMAC
jgi:hypothetical protein